MRSGLVVLGMITNKDFGIERRVWNCLYLSKRDI